MRSIISRFRWQARAIFALAFTLLLALASTGQAFAAVTLIKFSTDPYTNSTSQHQTEVEPDTFSFGSTIVSAFQVGRFPDSHGGSSNIGWATSTNNGATWKHGFLPGITVYAGGTFPRTTDPAVAYDAKHKVWLIASMGLFLTGAEMLVSRSTNGGLTWSKPVVVENLGSNVLLDKDWIVCDDTASSPFYGHCYYEYDNNSNGNLILMNTSTNGGLTWGPGKPTANHAAGVGGQPLVLPNGHVVVPIDNAFESAVLAFTSTNGGTSWGNAFVVQQIFSHKEAGGLRSGPLVSAEVDGAGNVYVFWQDCRFVSGCAANQLVFVVLTGGASPSVVRRVPINVPNATLPDFFIPGVAVDKSTSGSGAHLVVAFYYYSNTNCTVSTCQLNVGYGSSTNGGSTFSPVVHITGPMKLSWLPQSDLGLMVGDYISTSFSSVGKAFPAFAKALLPNGGVACSSAGAVCHESIYTIAGGVTALGGSIPSTTGRVVAGSDHPTPSTPVTVH